MKTSQFPLATLKETPADAEIISHQLMLRAGLIRRLSSGLYTWMPLGLRTLRKVENIIREEMDNAGALELLMPTMQPAELWEETERWDKFGHLLLKIKDRHERDFCYGPTHEEVVTDIARRELNSYKQLPVNYYQIQLKFRDEIRPRFGVMRAREFIMKDSYSFHTNQTCLQKTYDAMYDAYSRIFTRLDLKFRAVYADAGDIGGNASQEFHVLADSGEDAIAFSDNSDYAANIEKAETLPSKGELPPAKLTMQTVDTPERYSIEEVANFLNAQPEQCIKTLLVEGTESEVVALVLRGDHSLNEIKAANLSEIASPLRFASEQALKQIAGCNPGSVGPVGLDIPIIADYAAANLSDFICGANEDDKHLTGVNWQRDLPKPQSADLRNVVEGDPSPDGKGQLKIVRGIEVGHIFQLGDKYSQAMNASVLDENGKSVVMQMGCYGIGVTRIVAAAIEQNHDERGIIWPASIAPFTIALLPMNMEKSTRVKETSEKLYAELCKAGIDVLFDDRPIRPGVMFKDSELIGIPHRIVIGDKGLDEGIVEYKNRLGTVEKKIKIDQLLLVLKEIIPTI